MPIILNIIDLDYSYKVGWFKYFIKHSISCIIYSALNLLFYFVVSWTAE